MVFRLVPALLLAAGCCFAAEGAQSALERAGGLEQAGQTAELRAAVAEALRQAPRDPAALSGAAALLDLAGAPNRVEVYRRLLESLPANSPNRASSKAQAARRRLVLLYLQAGKYQEAKRALEGESQAPSPKSQVTSGTTWDVGPGTWDLHDRPDGRAAMDFTGYVEIPGPLLGFQRMAALRPDTSPDELLEVLARNVATLGYSYSPRLAKVVPTEYLKLLKAWLGEARELRALAGKDGVLRVNNCSEAAPLLKILGYRLRGACSDAHTAALEADDPARAFLASNSGFPIVQLEEAIQGKQPFQYSAQPVRVPVVLGPQAWLKPGDTWIDSLLEDRQLARLYVAMSQLESGTAKLLAQSPGIPKLKAVAPVLDFFGQMMKVEDGRALVPGGAGAAPAWKQLTGAGPEHPAAFFTALLEKDDGWMAAYFDALSRLDPAARKYFADPVRLVAFYRALRGRSAPPGPARPVFRGDSQLMLLVTRLRIQPDGTPPLPGGAGVWQAILHLKPARAAAPPPSSPDDIFKVERRSGDLQAATPQAANAKVVTPDQVVEALFARVREADEKGALNVFLSLNEIDRRRDQPLDADTALRLASQYARFSEQYALFAEWPQLSGATIGRFLDVIESLTHISDPLARADALGSFEAVAELWQILARQGDIPIARIEPVMNGLLEGFSRVKNAEQTFEASRSAFQALVSFAPPGPGSVQEKMIALLAAPPGIEDAASPVRDRVAAHIRSGLEAQRLVPIDTLFVLADELERAAAAGTAPGGEFTRRASRLKELNLPDLFPSPAEKSAAVFGRWTERHIQAEREADLAQAAQAAPDKLPRVRGLLAPHLRDSLVGLVYAYYAPPGSALLNNNPLFVRAHDFLGRSGDGTGNEIWGPGRVSGIGWPISGGGHFVGALSGIAYALADAEKDFLVPRHTQSLIWGELAPQVLLDATLPRWWRVSPRTQHYAALNIRLGKDLLAEAAVSTGARRLVLDSIPHLEPRRRERIEWALAQGRVPDALRLVTPAELYQLSRSMLANADQTAAGRVARDAGPAAAALEQMAREFPAEASDEAVGAAFGVPHPKLARSFRPELLNLPLFPTLMGYSSRLLAESWESSNLQWAELADELGLPPCELNRVAPQLTRQTLEGIFANHLDDWGALLGSMLAAAEDFRAKFASEAAAHTAESRPAADPQP